MSTSTVAAPPASIGADGPEPAPEADATGVLAGVAAAGAPDAAAVPGTGAADGVLPVAPVPAGAEGTVDEGFGDPAAVAVGADGAGAAAVLVLIGGATLVQRLRRR